MSQEHQYVCIVCGHEHHEQTEGRWEDLPDDFSCPECGAFKEDYEEFLKQTLK